LSLLTDIFDIVATVKLDLKNDSCCCYSPFHFNFNCRVIVGWRQLGNLNLWAGSRPTNSCCY